MAGQSKNKSNDSFFHKPLTLGLIIFAIAISFFLGSLWTKVKYLEGNSANSNKNVDDNTPPNIPNNEKVVSGVPELLSDEHIRGNKDAKVALIEYSDYDCPFCARFHDTAKQVLREYDDQVMWIYRHFPLDNLHPDARKKAEAAECIFEQGGNDAFWAFSDALYSTENSYTANNLSELVSSLDYDSNLFNDCLNNGDKKEAVNEHVREASKAGVTGTPGNFIANFDTGKIIELRGAVPLENIKQAIDSVL